MLEIQGLKLYDTQDLAAMLNVSRTTVSNLRNKGKLKYTRIGKKLYTSEEALREYLNGILVVREK